MITGNVQRNGEPVVTLRVRGTGNQIANVQVVVDTGFNDWLTLPSWVIEKLQLTPRQGASYLLADGSTVAARTFAADVEWMGNLREALVVETDGNALLGMMLLEGNILTMEVVVNGRIEIRPVA